MTCEGYILLASYILAHQSRYACVFEWACSAWNRFLLNNNNKKPFKLRVNENCKNQAKPNLAYFQKFKVSQFGNPV